jgi:glycosyltransferase involved in cell wall biosynthesis
MTQPTPKHSLRILLLSGVRGDTRRYRSLHLAEQCRLLGLPFFLTHITDPNLISSLGERPCDVAILHRVQMDRRLAQVLATLRRRNALVLYDTDDLVFDPDAIQYIDSPDFSDPVRRRLYRDGVERQRQALLACDGAIASTEFLAGRIVPLGLPVRVHRNAFTLEMAHHAQQARRARTGDSDTIIIGYASGTPTHDRDFALAAPALQNLMRQEPRIRLHLIGPLAPGPGWEGLSDRILRRPAVPWRALPGLLADFDINLAPLVQDNPFARSKSAIKFMEAALLHQPTIASPTDAFQRAIRDGENGFLAQDLRDWEDCLEKLVGDANLRARLGDQAAEDVWREDAPQVRAAELVETLNGLHQTIRGAHLWPQGSLPRVNPSPEDSTAWPRSQESQPTNWQLGWYTLRWRGPLPLLGGLWVWLRRRLAFLFPFKTQHPRSH